jgi:hypothetical protein
METGKSPGHRRRSAPSLATLRSAITNGSQLLGNVDHRGAWARRLRDLIAAILSDRGGEDYASEGIKLLARRASMLTLQLELLEQTFADQGGAATTAQLETYQRTTNTLRRLLETLGLQREARELNPERERLSRLFVDAYEVTP